MLSNIQLQELIPEDVYKIFSDLETEIIVYLAGMTGESDFIDMYTVNKTLFNATIIAGITAIISARKKEIDDVIRSTIKNAIVKNLKNDEPHYLEAVKLGFLEKAVPITESERIQAVISNSYKQAKRYITNNVISSTAINTMSRDFNKIIENVLLKGVSPQQAIKQAVQHFADNGIKTVKYASGRQMDISAYTRQVIVSTSVQGAFNACTERMNEYGTDLLVVSAHAGARPLCFPYQARVYSYRGLDTRFPAFSTTSYGKPAGLFGINCGHNPSPFIYGLDKVPTEEERDPAKYQLGASNEAVYKASQRQRALERNIRKYKHEEKAFKEAGLDTTKTKKKLKQSQAKMRDFIQESGRTRRTDRERI